MNFDVMGMADAAADEIGLLDRQVLDITYEDDIAREGIGRFGRLPKAMTLENCGEQIKHIFGLESVKIFGSGERIVGKAAICPGSGKSVIEKAAAMGADVLIMTGHAVDLYDPDVVVSAMGSFFNLPVIRVEDNNELFTYVEGLRNRYPGFTLLGTTAHKELPVYNADLTVPLMLMMGNETMGLNKAFKEACDVLCTIPMAETSYASSFNVSCAASVLMYEIVRQRSAR